MFHPILPFATAALAGFTVAVTLSRLSFAPSASRSLAGYTASQPAPGVLEQIGRSLLRRLPWLASLANVEHQRRWLALEGTPPSLAQLLGLALLLAALGLVVTLVTRIPAAGFLCVLGFVLPFARVRGRANRVRRRVQRSLPELTALMAAEMAAGNPPDRALERAGEWGGLLARLVQVVLEEARSSGRPVFGRGHAPGVLMAVVARYDLPALRAFASQIELAARKGAAGPELMESLARTLIIEYKDRALREAEALESRLAVPSVLFFFLPFLFLILVPLLWPVLQIL